MCWRSFGNDERAPVAAMTIDPDAVLEVPDRSELHHTPLEQSRSSGIDIGDDDIRISLHMRKSCYSSDSSESVIPDFSLSVSST
jgi:hypothetical protein